MVHDPLAELERIRPKAAVALLANRSLLAGQGSVHFVRRGKTRGYWRLFFRHEEGELRTVYLGRDERVARLAARVLSAWPAPRRERAAREQAEAALIRDVRAAKKNLIAELARAGLRMQGWEIRGWRAVQKRVTK